MSIRDEFRELATDVRTLRRFGLMVGGAFLLVGAFLLWRDVAWGTVLLWIGTPLVGLGATVPRVLRPAYLGWMAFALGLGAVMTRLILGLFYFLVLTPVGLFFRVVGRDAMSRRFDRQAKSYWVKKEYLIADRTRYEKFF